MMKSTSRCYGKDTSKVQVNQYVSRKGGNEALVDVPGGADPTGFNDYAFVWEKDRCALLSSTRNGPRGHGSDKAAVNAQKIFVSLWGTDTLKDWMGNFAFSGPARMADRTGRIHGRRRQVPVRGLSRLQAEVNRPCPGERMQ